MTESEKSFSGIKNSIPRSFKNSEVKIDVLNANKLL